ncbi:MAG: fasciclin domain-containing protein [Bacteroidota bacterium]
MLTRLTSLFLLLALAVAWVGCDGTDEEVEPADIKPLGQFIAESVRLNTLEAALRTAGLLNDDDSTPLNNVTVFAPEDAAFASLNALTAAGDGGFVDALLADEAALTSILQYHVVEGRILSSDLQDGQTVTTLAGEQLTIREVNGSFFVDGAPITLPDAELPDAVVHRIGKVLTGSLNVVEFALLSPNFSTLVTALANTGESDDAGDDDLVTTLSGAGPFTVFAPSNAAFGALPFATDSLLVDARRPTLSNVLTYHVVPGVVFSDELPETANTVRGVEVTFDGATVDEIAISATDFRLSNGILHVIDGVLLGGTTIAQQAEINPTLAPLGNALVEAGLFETFNGTDQFTVFAPANTAFVDTENGDAERVQIADASEAGLLAPILQYHVVEGRVFSRDLSNGQMVTTLTGETAEITIEAGTVNINGASVTAPNLRASNGVVHVIDEVLLSQLNVVERAIVTPGLDALVSAVVDAGLADALANTPGITVFAPNDAAFNGGGATSDVLLYHVAPAQGDGSPIFSSEITDGLTSPTLLDGQSLTFTFGEVAGDMVILINADDDGDDENDPRVLIADVETSNGVVHVINQVLMP